MKSSWMGLIGLLWVAAPPVEAFAQDRTGRARNQPLQEQLKPLDVFAARRAHLVPGVRLSMPIGMSRW